MFTITASVAAAKNGVHRRKVFWLGWRMADTWDDNEDLKSPLTMLLLLKNGTRGDERTEVNVPAHTRVQRSPRNEAKTEDQQQNAGGARF